jgi:hypothetical protein
VGYIEVGASEGLVEELVRIRVAWPPNGETIYATPTLIRVSREAAEDEETGQYFYAVEAKLLEETLQLTRQICSRNPLAMHPANKRPRQFA